MSKTPPEFIGQEVACRSFGRIITEWKKRGLPLESLVAGSGCTVDHLHDKNARISWAAYRTIMTNTRAVWDDDGFIKLGLVVVDTPLLRPFTIPGRLLYSAKDVYRAIIRPGAGITRQLFACIENVFHDLGPHHIVIEQTMQAGYPVCREYFLISKGAIIAMPKMVGLDLAQVEMQEIEGGFRYDIRLPKGGGALAWLRRALMWPFTARAAARELEEAYTLLHEHHAELEEKNIELAFRNAELERFTYTVSHDLKTPLVTIKGFLGLLEKDALEGDTEQMKRDIAQISSAADKMARLLAELLELSRVGRQVNPPEEIDLSELAGEAASLVAGHIQARGVSVEIAPSMPVVYGDRVRLLEVYQNLIDNAVKFMGKQPQPRIEVEARQNGEEVLCFVRDNGVGIDPRYHENIFGLFNRLNQDTEGTGVGLALVRRIVEVHGGRIWVESEGVGQGAVFYFTLSPTGVS